MSVPVSLDRLAEESRHYGVAYLVTVGNDARAHAVAVTPVVAADAVTVDGLGGRTRANLGSNPAATLLWPPPDNGGYTLIVDGDALVDGDVLRLVPARAVLHRPSAAGAAPDATGCASDCVELTSP